MEKINIAELLKDCPKGMELYSPIFGKVYLDKIRPHLAIVVTTDKEQGDFKEEFLYDGRYGMNGECMLFPSKGKTTWEGFHRPFKDGDIITCTNSCCTFVSIFKKIIDENIFVRYCAFILDDNKLKVDTSWSDFEKPRLATEEEKKKLFDAIKDNGYKWNNETKSLERLVEPKFKIGDTIRNKKSGKQRTITGIYSNCYEYDGRYISVFENQDNWELVPNKFDITTLKPFDKVLVRHDRDNTWCGSLLSHMDNKSSSYCYKFVTTAGKSYPMCIPYEGNEHLLGKTDDCDEFYKTWK